MGSHHHTVDRWIGHLHAMADPVIADSGVGIGAADLEIPFGTAVRGLPRGGPPPEPLPNDLAFWWALVEPTVDIDAVLGQQPEGSLLVQGRYRTLEVWTESELSSLHALWRLARERNRPDWRTRLDTARDWHVVHTQPDNATNRPWALHVFLLAGTPETRHYAETLLHNCIALEGRPDLFSAWILHDAACELELSSP